MDDNLDRYSLKRLRMATVFIFIVWTASILLAAFLFRSVARQESILLWIKISIPSALAFWGCLWIVLPANRSADYSMLQQRFNVPNLLSILRGLLLSSLIGFIFVPFQQTNLEYIPGCVFFAAILLDAADGALARMRGSTTLLGEKLDTSLDYAALVIGSLIMAAHSQSPLLFFLAAIMPVMLLGGKWLQRKREKPTKNNPYLRLIINLGLGYLNMALLPVFSSRVVTTLSYIFLLPLMVVILHDLLMDSGASIKNWRMRKPDSAWYDLILLIMRLTAAGVLMFSPAYPTDFSSFLPAFLCTMTAITGILPKIGMAGVLILAGGNLTTSIPDGLIWAALVLSASSLVLGAGRIAIWIPEDDWLKHGFKGGNGAD